MSGRFAKLDSATCVVGVIGGGQLGRMLVLVARRMGLRTVVWTGGREAPAAAVADEVIDLSFDDPAAVARFCGVATVATVEFENIPVTVLEAVADRIPLHPSPRAIGVCQHRMNEKRFLREHGIPCAPFAEVGDAVELASAMRGIGTPSVLKTTSFGYDGSGQVKLEGGEDAAAVWSAFGSRQGVLEAWIPFEKELSVMVMRDATGACVTYEPSENRHRGHILDVSIVPARIPQSIAGEARAIACRIAAALDYRGILGVEFFLTRDGALLVNEMAPRPHNSGHFTMDACETSQFDQQLRLVLGLPAGSVRLHTPVVMLNLLGDLWPRDGAEPDWSPLFADGRAVLHLYGKTRAHERRKMGHVNVLGDDVGDALRRAEQLKRAWLGAAGHADAS